ncbi:MAG TPA: LuxR C-terminal-related transcriptional regulator, partial [Pseudonocardiaceae bacterium]|nr:LuxR C-terminal-related transcriptional regulator [Pseudonocardiaceae bacterium]
GMRPGTTPDRFVVGVATVALLTVAGGSRPLLCVVDDVQGVDDASSYVLAFAARRRGSAPVALLLAGRGGGVTELPELVLDRLGHADARLLAESAMSASMDDAVIARIVVESAGNPLALIRSARAASGIELAGGYRVVPSTGGDHGLVTGLTPDSRLLLLLAAAEPLGDPVRLWRAATRLGIAACAAEQLESAGLVSFGPLVAFGEPELRSMVYGRASVAERRRVHRALADAIDGTAEPDRRAWHLAHALVGPDDTVGHALARAVGTARTRGGLAAAAAFYERAALCTTDPAHRVERAIRAADAYHTAGAADAAVRLLGAAELTRMDAPTRARLTRLRARIDFDASRGPAAVARLLAAAQDLEACEPQIARAAYLEALGAAIFTGHLDVAHTVVARLAAHQPKGTDRLLEGVAQRCTGGYAAAVEPLKLALKTLDCDHQDDPRSRLLACLIAPDLWDDDSWHELTEAELERARGAEARSILPYVLTHRALVEVHAGRFAVAQSLVDEAAAIAQHIGTPPLPHAAVVLAAWRGREHPVLAAHAQDENTGMCGATARYAKAVLYNGLGAYADAVTATRAVIHGDSLELQGWALAELVEGAVRSGARDTAAVAVDLLRERAWLSGTEWALGVSAGARALLRDGTAAEDLYVEAIDRLGRSRVPVYLARAQLVYGEWLRRRGRRVDARVPLRAAHRSFADMGAEAFAARATRELLATGERARRRVAETQGQLTPQETRIASLARDGRSNPEIATLLSISPRTVEYHLHKVFTKRGITSRNELHLVLTDVPSEVPGTRTPLRR